MGKGPRLRKHSCIAGWGSLGSSSLSLLGCWGWDPSRLLQGPQSAAMALAATCRPRGRLRSVMASTTLGLDMADTFTSSDTCRKR